MAKVHDIERVFRNYSFHIKRKGRTSSTNCPFHDDKDPSLTISEEHGHWKCWVCGDDRSGDVIEFVKQYRNMTYPEAIEELVKMHGFSYEELGYQKKNKSSIDFSSDDLTALSSCATIYTAILFEKENVESLNYLISRGFEESTIKRWRIGYAPQDRYTLIKKTKKLSPERTRLINLDMIKLVQHDHGESPADRFYDRIIFPIRNTHGQVIAFTGRTPPWEKGDSKRPKYLNNAETAHYKKGEVLFGLYESLTYTSSKKIYVLEGQTDVIGFIAMGQAACAPSGTALTDEQIKLLLQHYSEVVFLFDADQAGIKATYKAVDKALSHAYKDTAFYCAQLSGEDPHELYLGHIAEHGNGSDSRRRFSRILDEVTRPLSQFVLAQPAPQAQNLYTIQTPEDLASWSRGIDEFLAKVSGSDLKHYLTSKKQEIQSAWPDSPTDASVSLATPASILTQICSDPTFRTAVRKHLHDQDLAPGSIFAKLMNGFERRLIESVFSDEHSDDIEINLNADPETIAASLVADFKAAIKKRFAIQAVADAIASGSLPSNPSVSAKYFG